MLIFLFSGRSFKKFQDEKKEYEDEENSILFLFLFILVQRGWEREKGNLKEGSYMESFFFISGYIEVGFLLDWDEKTKKEIKELRERERGIKYIK